MDADRNFRGCTMHSRSWVVGGTGCEASLPGSITRGLRFRPAAWCTLIIYVDTEEGVHPILGSMNLHKVDGSVSKSLIRLSEQVGRPSSGVLLSHASEPAGWNDR